MIMGILYAFLIFLVSLGLNFLILYILYRIFKKYINSFLKQIDNIIKNSNFNQNMPVKDYYQQELEKVKEIIRKNTKK
jgi:hypothetical protein